MFISYYNIVICSTKYWIERYRGMQNDYFLLAPSVLLNNKYGLNCLYIYRYIHTEKQRENTS